MRARRHLQVPSRLEPSEIPGTGVTGGYESITWYRFWEPNLGLPNHWIISPTPQFSKNSFARRKIFYVLDRVSLSSPKWNRTHRDLHTYASWVLRLLHQLKIKIRLKKFLDLFNLMYMSVLPYIYVCAPHTWYPQISEDVSDPLELWLPVVSHSVGAGNQTWTRRKSSVCS